MKIKTPPNKYVLRIDDFSVTYFFPTQELLQELKTVNILLGRACVHVIFFCLYVRSAWLCISVFIYNTLIVQQ